MEPQPSGGQESTIQLRKEQLKQKPNPSEDLSSDEKESVGVPSSENQVNGIPIESIIARESNGTEKKNPLDDFDVLPSKIERSLFKYAYLYFVILLVIYLLELLIYYNSADRFHHIIAYVNKIFPFDIQSVISPPKGYANLPALSVGTNLILIVFLVWQSNVQKMLQDLTMNKRISVIKGDMHIHYHQFIEGYRHALASPVRHLFVAIFAVFIIIYMIDVNEFRNITDLLFAVPYILINLGMFYYLGTMLWILQISGKYIKRLLRDFKIRIDPIHPDGCGGLKLLGNFCLGLAAPPLVGSLFFFVYEVLTGQDPVSFGLFFFIIFAYVLPTIVFAAILPLITIHATMVSEKEADQERHAKERNSWQKKVGELLKNNQLEEEVKKVEQERQLIESLHPSYPTWPFNIKMQTLASLLTSSFTTLLSILVKLVSPEK